MHINTHVEVYNYINALKHTHTAPLACDGLQRRCPQDGVRKMERTEQLHEIYKKLYFGKLKPIPLVSVSMQVAGEERNIGSASGRTD